MNEEDHYVARSELDSERMLGRDIRKEIYYTVTQAREIKNHNDNNIDKRLLVQLKKNSIDRVPSQQSLVENIVEGRLERLAGVHYRKSLRQKAFYAINCNSYKNQKSQGASNHYIMQLMSKMVLKWRKAIEKRKNFRQEI